MSSKRQAPADSKGESKKLKKEEKTATKDKKPSKDKAEAKKSSEITYCGGPYEFTNPLPKKNKKGELVFEDEPEFRPNLTPKEVLQGGSFGGTYFRPIRSSVTGRGVMNFFCLVLKNKIKTEGLFLLFYDTFILL